MINLVEIGKIIKKKRLSLNMTMDFVAAKAKITRATLSNIEKGTANCSISLFLRLLDILDLDLSITNLDEESKRIRATRTNKLLDKKLNEFIIMAIEEYADSINEDSAIVYKELNEKGILDELKNDYIDLHGYSSVALNEHISYLNRREK